MKEFAFQRKSVNVNGLSPIGHSFKQARQSIDRLSSERGGKGLFASIELPASMIQKPQNAVQKRDLPRMTL
jgi:hypothetical protein